jgi:hypothetical protein
LRLAEERHYGSRIGNADAAIPIYIRGVARVGFTEHDGQHRRDVRFVDAPVAVGIAVRRRAGLCAAGRRGQRDE